MSDRYDRFHELGDGGKDRRSPGRHDRDRILYSSAFRRLGGITQVVAPTERHLIHNRLTHSLQVAQIGRSIAEDLLRDDENREIAASLGGLDPDVVEAAALAHDLGHPPFGHVTEMELDDLVKNGRSVADGFEGNAQTFRIVTRLAVRYPDLEGLNLTRATLCAILKYPWLRGTTGDKARKWGAYGSEQDLLTWARALMPPGSERKSLEAEIMDWSDDVAYAVHDMEDFFRAGLIPLDRLASDIHERERFLEAETRRRRGEFGATALKDAFDFVMMSSPTLEPYRGRSRDRGWLRNFTSSLIDRYISAVSLNPIANSDRSLVIDDAIRTEVAVLKGLTWHYVIDSRSLTAQRFGQRSLVQSLFDILCNAAGSKNDWHVFPEIHQEALAVAASDSERVVRVVADLISSMAESHLIAMHQRLTGSSLGSAMDPIVP